MKIGPRAYILRIGPRIIINWKGRIIWKSSAALMARELQAEEAAARARGERELDAARVIRRFELSTGGLRLDEEEACGLLVRVHQILQRERSSLPSQEKSLPLCW